MNLYLQKQIFYRVIGITESQKTSFQITILII